MLRQTSTPHRVANHGRPRPPAAQGARLLAAASHGSRQSILACAPGPAPQALRPGACTVDLVPLDSDLCCPFAILAPMAALRPLSATPSLARPFATCLLAISCALPALTARRFSKRKLRTSTPKRAFSPSCVHTAVKQMRDHAQSKGLSLAQAWSRATLMCRQGCHPEDGVRVTEAQARYAEKQRAKPKVPAVVKSPQQYVLNVDLLKVEFAEEATAADDGNPPKTWLELFFRLLKCWGGYGSRMRKYVMEMDWTLVIRDDEFCGEPKFVELPDSKVAIRLSFSKPCILPAQAQLNAAIKEFSALDSPQGRARKRPRDDSDDLPPGGAAPASPRRSPSKRPCTSPALSAASTQPRSAQESPCSSEGDDSDDDIDMEDTRTPDLGAMSELAAARGAAAAEGAPSASDSPLRTHHEPESRGGLRSTHDVAVASSANSYFFGDGLFDDLDGSASPGALGAGSAWPGAGSVAGTPRAVDAGSHHIKLPDLVNSAKEANCKLACLFPPVDV